MNKAALIIRMQVCCEHKFSLPLDKYQGIAGIITYCFNLYFSVDISYGSSFCVLI